AGFPLVVAAGNGRQNACNASPAGARRAFAMAASDEHDRQAYFSNYGRCTRLYAPGMDITSTWIARRITQHADVRTVSGTSMAAAHVSGVAALYLARQAYSNADDLYSALTSHAGVGRLTRVSPGTPNRIVSIGNA
ncbi:peptidase S8/S53 domain-containing protein, partial [Syncephalis pseudoplumigaleata]